MVDGFMVSEGVRARLPRGRLWGVSGGKKGEGKHHGNAKAAAAGSVAPGKYSSKSPRGACQCMS